MTDYEPNVFPLRARGPIPKGAPDVVARAARKAAKQLSLDEAYAAVDKRDGMRDRVTGHRLVLGGVDERARCERHHILPRSTHPELRHEPDNIIQVSALVHRLIEAGIIEIEGTSAKLPNTLRFHYKPGTPKDQRLVVIRSRRKSQREAE